MHYRRWRRHGDPNKILYQSNDFLRDKLTTLIFLLYKDTPVIAVLDTKDFDRLHVSDYYWHAQKDVHTFYASAYIQKPNGMRRALKLHRLLMPDIAQVDHKNHNGLDCRRPNLRGATNAQSNMNRRKQAGTSSRYKGISWNARAGKWQAEIQANGKHIYLGRFTSEIEAARAYDNVAIKYHRDFAVLNFPQKGKV